MIHRAPRISKRQQNILFTCFASDMHAYCKCEGERCAARRAKVSRVCANRYYRHYRERIYMHLRRAPRFSGEVEMDQSFFGGRGGKKVREELKKLQHLPHTEYVRRMRELRKASKVQVFGILQRHGDVYVQIIQKADRATLMPIIRLVVQEGAIVYTDKWRGFVELAIDGYEHRSINHSIEYSDQKGTHINSIEAFWSFTKRRLSKFNGISRTTLPLHLKESEFRYNHKADLARALKALL